MAIPISSVAAAARGGHGNVCIHHRTLWRLLRIRLQARLQDQGLWGLHTRAWGYDRQNGLPGDCV